MLILVMLNNKAKLKVFIAGGNGMVGRSLARAFSQKYYEVYQITRSHVDFLDKTKTHEIILNIRPDIVIDAAAKVGGIRANNLFKVQFLQENLIMQINLMDASHLANVKKFIFLGSSCIYPRNCGQPIKEEYLLTGQLEPTNSSYAIAKIAGIELINSYRKQYSRSWISVMPTNLYGPFDNFSKDDSHVLPAMIRKFLEAVENKTNIVELWGSGKPLREFLHVDDLASAIVLLSQVYDSELHINVGSGQEISIANLAKLISEIVGFKGEIFWNTRMPDGTPRKVLDSYAIRDLGWEPLINLESGIRRTVDWYKDNRQSGGLRI